MPACRASGRRHQLLWAGWGWGAGGGRVEAVCVILSWQCLHCVSFFLPSAIPSRALPVSIHLYALGVQAIDLLALAIKSEKGSQSEQDSALSPCGNL